MSTHGSAITPRQKIISNNFIVSIKKKYIKSFNTLEIRVFDDGCWISGSIIPEMKIRTDTWWNRPCSGFPPRAWVWYHDLYMLMKGVHVKKWSIRFHPDNGQRRLWTFKLPAGPAMRQSLRLTWLITPACHFRLTGKTDLRLRLGHKPPRLLPLCTPLHKGDVARLSEIAAVKVLLQHPGG